MELALAVTGVVLGFGGAIVICVGALKARPLKPDLGSQYHEMWWDFGEVVRVLDSYFAALEDSMNRKTVPTEPSLHVQVQNVADITQKVHQKVRNVSYVDFSKDIMQASSARVWTLVGTALILVSLVLGLTAQVIALRADAESKGVHATHPDRRQAEPQAAGADQKGPEVLSQPQQKSEGQR